VGLAAAAVLAVLALATAGVFALRPGRAAAPAGRSPAQVALIGGVPLQQARCVQWLGGTPAQRQAIVGVLAAEVGGPSTTGGRGSTLTGAQAATLFAHTCASPIARHFLLYELYIRAAAFRSYMPAS
jgi:hypothetical protein